MTILEIGCCGAYCRTCKEYQKDLCKGCKLGYDTGERDINRAKCRIKLCCFKERELQTCADCNDMDTCEIIQSWFAKGYKYQLYQRSLIYIRENGYDRFIEKADDWNNAKGKL